MKPPYIKKISETNGFSVFYVNGKYIREHIEKDFPNFSAHYYFKFIPENEIWVDKEFSKKEYKYFIEFIITREKAIQGKTPEEARQLGNKAEQAKRDKSKIIRKLKKLSKKEQIKKVHKRFLKKYSNNKIKTWLVNGFLVRSLYFLDFTAGGHEKVYGFVPENEIWVDDALNPKERESLLLHELYERRLMAQDKTSKTKQESYLKTHKMALELEAEFRNNRKALKQRIKQELALQP